VYSLGCEIMAQAPTIPVRVRKDQYDDPGKLYQLPYDARALLAKGLPALGLIDIFPYTNNYRRVFVRPGELSKHYEIRWIKDLKTSRWRHTMLNRRGNRCGYKTFEEDDPDRGKVITRTSPVKLLGLPEATNVLFMHEGVWMQGVVDPYVNQIQAKKAVEKFKKKAKEKVRRYLRLPTIWDRLSRED